MIRKLHFQTFAVLIVGAALGCLAAAWESTAISTVESSKQ
jgi:hypothetical protein